jgi:hypothetical protein
MTALTMPRSRSISLGYALVNLLIAVVVAYGCFLLVNDLVGVVRAGDLLVGTLPVKAQVSPLLVRLPPGLHHDGSLAATLQIEDASAAQAAFATAMDALQIAFYVAILWLLRGIAGSIRRRDPFGPANVRRLRAIGFLLVFGTPAVEAINTGLGALLFAQLPSWQTVGLGSARYGVPAGSLIAGLGAFILAQVFAHGLELREDSEGTI